MSGCHNITDTSITQLAEYCRHIKESNINDKINARMVMHMVILKFKLLDFVAPLADFEEGESVGGGSEEGLGRVTGLMPCCSGTVTTGSALAKTSRPHSSVVK